MLQIDTQWNLIESQMIRDASNKAGEDDEQTGAKSGGAGTQTVYKDGQFVKNNQPAEPQSEIDEFAGRDIKPTLTAKELRARLGKLADQ